jgi:hypothetical protein
MSSAISLCGFNCEICPAYKLNIKSEKDRESVDEGSKNFHKTRGWVYKERYCEGCFKISGKNPLWASCYIRRCVLLNDVENCGYCLDFPCPRIKNIIRATKSIAKRTKDNGTQEDYQKFALPHLNESRLKQIHQGFMETISEKSC